VAAALRRAKAELRALPPPPSDEAGLKDFLALEQLRSRLEIECAAEARLPGLCLPFMCPGRVVRVKGGGLDGDWGWGAVVGFQCRSSSTPPFSIGLFFPNFLVSFICVSFLLRACRAGLLPVILAPIFPFSLSFPLLFRYLLNSN
jgi:hypothetical protein